MINNLQHKQLAKQPKLLLFIIDHGGMKIHYNGITTYFNVYSVFKSIRINRWMRDTMNWQLKNKYYVTEKNWIDEQQIKWTYGRRKLLKDDTDYEISSSYWLVSLEHEMEPSAAPWGHRITTKLTNRNVKRSDVHFRFVVVMLVIKWYWSETYRSSSTLLCYCYS